MKKLTFILVAVLLGYQTFAQDTDGLVNNYIHVKTALVAGNSNAVSEALSTLKQGIKDDGNFAEKDALLKATETMAKAGNIAKQRASFNQLSTLLWAVVKRSEKLSEPVYYQYCPMKKAYWLSKEKSIKNPYYGSAMLACGKVVETK